MKHSAHIVTVLLIIAVALSACGGSGPAPTKAPEQEAATPQQVQPTTPPQPKPTSTPAPTATLRPTATPEPTATPKPVEPGTSRSNPLPLGSEFIGKTWSITITDVIRGQAAAQAVAAANRFNEPPREGFEYLIANLKLKNISTKQEAESAGFAVDLRVTGDRNIVYNSVSVVPPKSLEGELFPEGVAEGQEVFEVPSDERNLMFIVDEMMSFDREAVRFVAVDPDAKISPDPALKQIKPTDLGKQRDAPAKIGETLVSGAWEYTVFEAIRGDKAAEMISQANRFNDPAPEGEEYVLVRLRARYLGADDPDRGENIGGGYLRIFGEKNVVYETPSVVAPDPALDATLFAGGETEGWEVLSVAKDEKGLTVMIQPLFSFSKDEIRYVLIE